MVLRLAALLAILVSALPAQAQSCGGQFPAGLFCGNPTSATAPPRPTNALPWDVIVSNSSLPNGGRLNLQKDSTSTLSGNVAIDVVGQTFRIFEGGGSFRGVSIDLTQAGASASTDLLRPPFTALGTGAQLQTVDSKLKQVVNVQDFMPNGANLCDGTTDVTVYYRAAILAAAGRTLNPPDSGVCRVTGDLEFSSAGTTLRGTYPDLAPVGLDYSTYKGSWIFFDFTPAVAEQGILVNAPGVVIERMGFITQQSVPGSNGLWTPTVNPWVIRLNRDPFSETQSIDPIIRDVFIYNAYNGIWLDGAGGAHLQNVTGLAFHTGLWSTNNFGHLDIDNWTTNPAYETAVSHAASSRSATVTITATISSPIVINWTGHGLANGAIVALSTTGALPAPLVAGNNLYVVNASTNSFQVAATSGGSAINATGNTQSGTQTAAYSSYISYQVYQAGHFTAAKLGRNDGIYIKGFNALIAKTGIWFNDKSVYRISVTGAGSGGNGTTTASVSGCTVAPVLVPVISGGQLQSVSVVDGGAQCTSPTVSFGGAGTGFAATAQLETGGSATAFRIERPYFDGVVQGFVFDASGTRGNVWGMTYGWAGNLNTDATTPSTAVQTTANADFNYVEFSGSSILSAQRAVVANGTGVSGHANFIAFNNSTAYNYDVNNEGYAALTVSGTYDQIVANNSILSTGPSAYTPGTSSAPVSSGDVAISGFSPSARDTWQVILSGPQAPLTVTSSAIQVIVPEIDLFGSIDGHVTIGIAAHAGTPVIGFGTNSGTFAVSATAPITVNSTTGNISTSLGANTILGNATSGTAAATALSIGSCSTASSALQWTTNTGFGCNTSITAAAVPASGITGLGAGVATFLATPSSANLIAALTDETGTGAAVFANTPTLVTPVLGVATATSINKVAITAPATSATLTIANGKTLTANASLTLAGTDSTTFTFPGTSGAVLTADSTATLTNKTFDTAGTGNSFSINGVAATANTGTGSVVRATAPTIAGGSITGLTGLAIRDTSAAFDVTIAGTSSTTLTAGRTLTIDMVNAARTLKLGANLTLATDPGAVTGALKSNGTGTFGQAACADLSNGTTNCSAAVGQLPGTTTNDNAAAGKVGEYVSSTVVAGSAVSLTTGTTANLTSISLTAGDWIVSCHANFLFATGTVTTIQTSITETSATTDDAAGRSSYAVLFGATPGAAYVTNAIRNFRVSTGTTKTEYCAVVAGFSATGTVWGIMDARRVR